MKDGVYMNRNKDIGNLLLVTNGRMEDGDAVSMTEYDGYIETLDESKCVVRLTFKNLEYLGDL